MALTTGTVDNSLLGGVGNAVKRYLRRRHQMVVYSAAIVLCMTLTIVSCRVLVPQSHIQERLAIWWVAPRLDSYYGNGELSGEDATYPNPYVYAMGRQLLDTSRYEDINDTVDPKVELEHANTLKRDIFSDEASDLRNLKPGKKRPASSRVAEVILAKKAAAPVSKEPPFKDLALTIEERIDDLVNKMTLKEMIAESRVVRGKPTPGVKRLGVRPFLWDNQCSNRQQHGGSLPVTVFPENLGLAAAFSPDLVRNVSNAIAIEVRARWNKKAKRSGGRADSGLLGLNCFGPTANLMRHPLWGRNQETFGEDPYLAGQMIASYVTGLQGNHPRYVRVAAGCKHLAAHSGGRPNQQQYRHQTPGGTPPLDIKLSEQDFHMTYLPPFKACVQAGAQSVTCSNNRINGISVCTSLRLLNNTLRYDWGFNGVVSAETHGADLQSASSRAKRVRAGCNLEVMQEERISATERGNLTLEEVRENIKPILRMRMRLGEFDPPTMTPYRESSPECGLYIWHQQSQWYHPKQKNIMVMGPFANYAASTVKLQPSATTKEYSQTLLQLLAKFGPTAHVQSCQSEACNNYNDAKGVQSAVSGADIVFVCLGSVKPAGERRATLQLPGKQLKLLQDAVTYKKPSSPLVLLLFAGGPVDVAWPLLAPGVNVILYCSVPGTASGGAILRILTRTGRKSSPVGRLPFTWPSASTQLAPMEDYSMAGQTYRYFNAASPPPLFPFGFGLSYSRFNYTSMSISPKVISPGKSITVTISLQNLGPYGTEEITQLYMHWGAVAALAPKLQLVGYKRVYLNVGPAVTFRLVVKAEQMAIWIDREVKFAILPGEMTLYVGGQQPFQKTKVPSNVLKSTFTITR